MAIVVNKDYVDGKITFNNYTDNRVQFIKCKFEDLPTTAKDVSIFIDNNVIYFVDNDTIPRQYTKIIPDDSIALY